MASIWLGKSLAALDFAYVIRLKAYSSGGYNYVQKVWMDCEGRLRCLRSPTYLRPI